MDVPAVMTEDPYRTLGVASTASPREIRAAWLAAIKVVHPDTAGKMLSDEAAKINAAYTLLRDPDQRARLDLDRRDAERAARPAPAWTPGPGADPTWTPRPGPSTRPDPTWHPGRVPVPPEETPATNPTPAWSPSGSGRLGHSRLAADLGQDWAWLLAGLGLVGAGLWLDGLIAGIQPSAFPWSVLLHARELLPIFVLFAVGYTFVMTPIGGAWLRFLLLATWALLHQTAGLLFGLFGLVAKLARGGLNRFAEALATRLRRWRGRTAKA
jgi:hypothetical protein